MMCNFVHCVLFFCSLIVTTLSARWQLDDTFLFVPYAE